MPKKKKFKEKRKSDRPFEFGKLKIPQRLFKFIWITLAITAWLIFSANFDLKFDFFSCGSTPQKIPMGETNEK